jgi:hypothetical protein
MGDPHWEVRMDREDAREKAGTQVELSDEELNAVAGGTETRTESSTTTTTRTGGPTLTAPGGTTGGTSGGTTPPAGWDLKDNIAV